MNLEQVWDLVLGGITVTGALQWARRLVRKAPDWVWSIAAALMAVGYSLAPPWARYAAGILSVSQLGYETLIRPLRKTLQGGKDEG